MIVRSVKDVFIRTRSPYQLTDNKKGVLYPGFELEVEEASGELVDGNSRWYRDKNGDYYWSGGFEKSVQSQPLGLADYSKIIQDVPQELVATRGNGITVAVLDTGIYEAHPDFGNIFIQPSQNYTNSPVGYNDKNGHGSHVAGLIGARSPDNVGIMGVAPDCRLRNLKVLDDNKNSTKEWLGPALTLLKSAADRADVANFSFSLTTTAYNALAGDLKLLSDAGTILVGAIGDNTDLTDSPLLPAYDPNFISVGCVSATFMKDLTGTLNGRVDFVMEMKDLLSCSSKESGMFATLQGSSMATGLVSGLVALIMASGDRTLPEIRTRLKGFATPLDNFSPSPNLILYKL